MNLYATLVLLPLGVIIYTFGGGLKATFTSSYLHTVIIFITVNVMFFVVRLSLPLTLLLSLHGSDSRALTEATWMPRARSTAATTIPWGRLPTCTTTCESWRKPCRSKVRTDNRMRWLHAPSHLYRTRRLTAEPVSGCGR